MRSAGPSSRPPPPGPLNGREAELARLSGWLAEDARAIALAGPPGVGKSALARALAHATERRVVFVDATSIERLDDLDAALCSALGIATPTALDASLAAAAPCVTVIDGADRLGPALAAWVRARAAAGPEHALLVTARARIDAAGEVLEVGPLSSDASRALWIERVRQLRGSYAPEGDELAAIAELLHALDGLPLAIELAAARAALVGTFALARSLAAGGGPVTLDGVLDDAWARLEPPLAEALARLSVFRGAFDAAAAASVLALDDAATFDRLHRLRHASLLSAVSSSRRAGELGLRLLGPIRDHARRRLDAGAETAPAIRRHAAHYAALAARGLAGEDVALGEPDELARVMDRALAGDVPLAHGLVVALAAEKSSWAASAWLAGRLPALVAAAEGAVDEGLLADAELALARLRVQRGPIDEAEARCARGRAIHERRGDARGLARAYRTEALIASQLGRLGDAEAAAAASVRHAAGDRALEGLALHTVARLALRRGDHDAAVRSYEDALERHRSARDRRWEALALAELAIVHLDRGEVEAAEARVEAGLAMDVPDALVEALFLGAQGNVAHERGALDAAITGYERAAERAERHGNPRYAGLCRGYRGVALLEQGRFGGAQVALEDAAAAMRAVGDAGHDRLFASFALVARLRQGAVVDDLAARLAVPEGADAWLAGALAALAAGLGVGATSLAVNGLDARLAARVAGARPARAPEPDLVLGPTWFATPARGKVDTRRRAAGRRILEALAEHRDRALDADALIAAGWPGERILPGAAKNRLHVTLHRLRDLGLREGLVLVEDGWMLAPELVVARG